MNERLLFIKALENLCPTVKPILSYEFKETDNGFEITKWLTDEPQPTNETIQQQIDVMKATQYRNQRAAEYPSIGDQLDAIWKFLEPTDGTEAKALQDAILAIKEKYPKPTDTE